MQDDTVPQAWGSAPRNPCSTMPSETPATPTRTRALLDRNLGPLVTFFNSLLERIAGARTEARNPL